MIISVASGKGGTGKTTISTSLSLSLGDVQFIDCDVEEPDAHLFLKPVREYIEPVYVRVPEINREKCNYCGLCGSICQFHAIVSVKKSVLTFPELCHSCGGCIKVCPSGALKEIYRETGIIEAGHAGSIEFYHGILNIGEAKSPPLIKELKKKIKKDKTVIIDCPPGTTCPVITSVKGSDFVILVTEPTPFGLNDFILAVEMLRALSMKHFGVIINRSNIGDNAVSDYCNKENIPILMEIKNFREIAEGYSRGKLLLEIFPSWKDNFRTLFHDMEKLVKRGEVL